MSLFLRDRREEVGNAMKQSLHSSLYGPNLGPPVNIPKEAGSGEIGILSGHDTYHTSSDATLFSCSLPVLPHEKVNLDVTESVHQSVDDVSCSLNKHQQGVDINDSLENVEAHAIGSLLPDDEDELLAGIMDDLDLYGLPSSLEDLEDYDLFGGGGMELETDLQDNPSMGMSNLHLSDGVFGSGMPHFGISNGVGSVAGEHPYGEHPSRTLFVRNINSNVEDSELRALFEQYGDIRTLYTACKHRGFVMISYYDIRAARTAMRALQNRALRRRKLDIHFSIPKDNPSDKDINQGTLVVFNLDPSVSNEDLLQIFGPYGEVKEIRETPNKRHHKFIEFYDARAAESALKSLNRSDIAGKRIKLEPSRPGGSRRNLMLQLNQDLEQDEPRSFRHQVGSPVTNAQFNDPIEHGPLQTVSKSPVFRTMSPTTSNHLPGLASILHSQLSSSAKVASLGNDIGRGSRMEHTFTNPNSVHGVAFHQSHSLPDPKISQFRGTMSPLGFSNGSGMETISGPQFLWGSPNTYSEHTNSSAWAAPSMGHPYSSNDKGHGYLPSGRNGLFLPSSQLHHQPHHHHHHFGSAPSGIPLESHSGFFPKSPETSIMGPVVFGGMSLGHGDGSFMKNMSVRPPMNTGISVPRNTLDNASSLRMMFSPRLSPVFLGNGLYSGVTPASMEGSTERSRGRRVESNGNEVDNKKQFQLELDKIISGEDTRTTLMIKNIPNKYTSKMLLAAIDENHKGTYDFLYLPIDFKNKCNVGYAFINMLTPKHIVSFYEAFNGKKWEKFNSEKVASLAYARIQGKPALVSHFQNSSLMNEDKRCRPILFHSGDTEAGEQELLPSNNMNIQVRQQEESYFGDFPEIPSKDGCES